MGLLCSWGSQVTAQHSHALRQPCMVGFLPRTEAGHKQILGIMDFATRWLKAIPLLKTDSQTIADVPEEILMDCGTNCESHHAGTTQTNGVKGFKMTSYHPESDGMVKWFNSTLKTMIRKTLKLWKRLFDLALPHILGKAPHATTGYNPSDLLYGRLIKEPLQTLIWDGQLHKL